MGDFMDGLDAEAYDRSYTDWQLLRRIAGYFRPQARTLLLVAVLVIFNALLDIAYPILISRTLDTLVASRTLQTVLLFIGILLLVSLLSWLCNLFRQWFTARAVGNIVLKLREDAFTTAIGRDLSFFDSFSAGRVVSRITTDTESFATVLTLPLNLLSQVLVFLFLALVLFTINPTLALFTFIIFPFIILATFVFRSLARRSTSLAQRSLANVSAIIQEAISGITVAKNFRQEHRMYQIFDRVNRQSYQVNLRSNFVYCYIYPVFGVITNIGTAIVLYFGGLVVLEQRISLGEWYLFVQTISLLWVTLTSIATFWSLFQLGLSASERVFALIDAEAHVKQHDNQPLSELKGDIELRDISFGYTDQQTVLHHIDLHLSSGETIALVGHTGAGKTSLGRLIARFYEFQSGELLIDGRDIRTLDLPAYRSKLGIVPQTPFLFSGTIADNIRYARPTATPEEVSAMAQHIGGGDWLKAFPDGLETHVGEGGSSLSPGQRQLVALARVLLQNPSVIILDEATSSVDPLTEAQLQEGLELVLQGRTAILIAHRLSTIMHADRIVVLYHGNIVEQGKHDALLQRGGYYAHLYNIYYRHQSANYQPGEGFLPVTIPIDERQAETQV